MQHTAAPPKKTPSPKIQRLNPSIQLKPLQPRTILKRSTHPPNNRTPRPKAQSIPARCCPSGSHRPTTSRGTGSCRNLCRSKGARGQSRVQDKLGVGERLHSEQNKPIINPQPEKDGVKHPQSGMRACVGAWVSPSSPTSWRQRQQLLQPW